MDDIVVELPDTLDDAYDRIMASWARNSMPEDVQAAKSKIFPAMMAALEPLLTSEVSAIARDPGRASHRQCFENVPRLKSSGVHVTMAHKLPAIERDYYVIGSPHQCLCNCWLREIVG